MKELIFFVSGFTVAFVFCTGIYVRMVKRLVMNHDSEKLHEWIQKRKDATDFGVTDELPPGAGPSSVVQDLWHEYPGSLAAESIRSEKFDGKA